MKKFYKQMVLALTAFLGWTSGIFILSGAGSSRLNLLVGLIFFVSLINISLYIGEYYKNLKKYLVQFNPSLPKPRDQRSTQGEEPQGDIQVRELGDEN
ncbi:MAG: hypothetical protein LBV77_01970 [Candidatus Adiutrix intracellularis]|jgi:hypothetical protein|nr:hypothetical protein [Candidatus Adiutrix intracellularis]